MLDQNASDPSKDACSVLPMYSYPNMSMKNTLYSAQVYRGRYIWVALMLDRLRPPLLGLGRYLSRHDGGVAGSPIGHQANVVTERSLGRIGWTGKWNHWASRQARDVKK